MLLVLKINTPYYFHLFCNLFAYARKVFLVFSRAVSKAFLHIGRRTKVVVRKYNILDRLTFLAAQFSLFPPFTRSCYRLNPFVDGYDLFCLTTIKFFLDKHILHYLIISFLYSRKLFLP